MKGSQTEWSRLPGGAESKSAITGNREAYYYVKDASGNITWHLEGDKALTAWDQAGGYDKAALYCGRKPHAMQRVR